MIRWLRKRKFEVKSFEKQKVLVDKDISSSEQGLNVLDKGYRSTLAAQMCGQQCIHPDFAQCD